MNKFAISVLAVAIGTTTHLSYAKSVNPFANPSPLPLQAPQFDKIKDSDYLPAYGEGMKQQLDEINQIANNQAPATFENTIEALEKSGQMLERVSEVFSAITQANTNDTLEKLQQTINPKLAEHNDAIFLNPKLFSRIKTVYEKRNQLKLDQESSQLLSVYYQKFIHNGAELSDADKSKLKDLNKKIATLETTFQQKLIAGSKSGELVINNKADLDGLSDLDMAAYEKSKDNKKIYVIPLQNTTQQPLLHLLTKRNTREQLFKKSWTRTEQNDANDTRTTIKQLAALRAEKAALLGYSNFAAYNLYDQMAETPQSVHQFLDQLIPATTIRTTTDAKQIQTMIDQTDRFKLKPWDWNYYAEKIRKSEFDLDQKEIMPYFELNHVLKDGVFYAATQLYGITFKERHDLPVYHPDVRVFDVFDHDNTQLGLLYLDHFKRDNKSGGAWMSNFVQQSKLLNAKPVVYNVTNFTKPAAGQPALLTSDDVRTMFHEFGHALHGLFSDNKYPLSSSSIARDFVEMPSQFNEHWAYYPSVLKNYAIHYKTGKPMPNELMDKIKKAETFNQGYSLAEILAASEIDMYWHELNASNSVNSVDAFEKKALKLSHTDFANIPPRYRSSYFLHIWANGYPSGYYAYLWSEMLDDNIYEWFTQHGGLTRNNGQRFRDMVLSRGHTEDYNVIFKSFNGKEPSIEPLLRHRGISNQG